MYLLKYKQGEQEYYTTVMDFEFIKNYSEVLIYGKDKYGYQRELVPSHYKKIASQIIKNKNELISPTSIILGVDKEKMNNILTEIKPKCLFEMKKDKINEKIFRIVDGQHRLEGLKEALKKEDSLKEYQLSVVIMVLDEEERKREIDVFKNINSKAKKLKIDLTILASYKYNLLRKTVKEDEIESFILSNICHEINKFDGEENPWLNGIKMNINAKDDIGIVGFKSFFDSIKKMISKEKVNEIQNMFNRYSLEEILEVINKYSLEKAKEIILYWVEIKNVWKECFNEREEIIKTEYIDMTYIKLSYKENYYLQKTMGMLVMNELICKSNSPKDLKEMLIKSKLKSEDWIVGGKFSGLSSISGKNYIINEYFTFDD